MPAATSADFELRSFSGSLQTVGGGSSRRSTSTLDFRTGNGGAKVRGRTSGTIHRRRVTGLDLERTVLPHLGAGMLFVQGTSPSDMGGRLVAGGEPAKEGALAKGSFYKPTVFSGVEPGATIAVEEIFGPVLAMVKVKDFGQAVAVNNASRYGLSSSIFTADVNRAFAAMRDLETGIVYVNHGTTGAETHLPFGGTRGTGNGHREAGHTMLDPFTEWKSIYVDFSGRLQRAQIDTDSV